MIKVNLFPGKKKKKSKPLPTFLLSVIGVTVATLVIMAYLTFFFSSRLSARKELYAKNERTITELKEKIKEVEDFEERNRVFKQRSDIIEQLSKNKSVPVKILDEISALLPPGVWLTGMTVTDAGIGIDGTGFSNPEIVVFVDNVKNSAMFTEVYLQESKSVEIEKIPLYTFKLKFQVKP